MARIRSVKPEFWTDDTVTECSLSARLLFIGTWNFADDAGNLDRSAKQLKARVFPVDKVDCEPLLRELITHGLLIEYSVDGKKYLHIPGFADHQVINRPSKPSCPAFDESMSAQPVLTEHSVSTHSGGEGKGIEGKDHAKPSASSPMLNGHSPKRGTRIPDDFAPDLAYARAQALDIDAEREAEKFCDWWRAKAGKDGLKNDWQATWRTWVRNGIDRGSYARLNTAGAGTAPIFR